MKLVIRYYNGFDVECLLLEVHKNDKVKESKNIINKINEQGFLIKCASIGQ